jgi:hypothetical protein
MITPHRRNKIICDFFDKSDAKSLIVYKDFLKLPEIIKHIVKNRKEETQTFKDFNEIFQDPKKLITLTGFISKKFNVTDTSTMRLMSNYFIFHGLNYLEDTGTILKEFINPTKKIGKKKIRVTENTTLNTLVISLAQELGMKEFEELFPTKLCNVLGHPTWYFKNNGLCWIDEKGNGVSLPQNEFVSMLNEFDSNFVAILDEWIRRKNKIKP